MKDKQVRDITMVNSQRSS